ncbi:MAG: AmmeMemoRadiSam system radical SAM enzyme [Sandaracinaceae bacterium]|nr:AmmeMemoRadiSam system radical SAM enzyme [Sandaracinaceae bacterium]
MSVEKQPYITKYVRREPDGRLRCEACPRHCKLQDGQKGLCFVREHQGDHIVLTTHGRSSGFCIDPIEKKPLAHFLPGTSVLSFGTAGCNLTCKFCQNWEMSKSREIETLSEEASPESIARVAHLTGCSSVAFTYNDPTIFLEYAMDVADACHALGIRTVSVTAGYIGEEARRDLYAKIDAANVDLKAFTESFYKKVCGGELERVKETLVYLVKETKVWTEITTLLIPGYNDSDAEIHALCAWVREALHPGVPIHFTAFHPDFRMMDVPPTPPSTLRRARRIAQEEGLLYAYVGNVHDPEGETTYCAGCGSALIVRDWYEILAYRLDAKGRCIECGTALPGVFDRRPGRWGRKRVRLSIANMGL